jgi:hypothetical protein
LSRSRPRFSRRSIPTIGLIDGVRFKEYADDTGWAGGGDDITRIYHHELAASAFEVLPGPGKLRRWSLPASRGHNDLLVSTALTAKFDAIDWRDRTARGHSGTCAWLRTALSDVGASFHQNSRHGTTKSGPPRTVARPREKWFR